jgi:hypothetical protein
MIDASYIQGTMVTWQTESVKPRYTDYSLKQFSLFLFKPPPPSTMRWRSWLRHCATSQKVAGSIPDGVTGIIHGHNPSGRTVAVVLTQPLTEMSTRNTSWREKAAGA